MVKFWCLAALNRGVYPTPFNRNGCVEGWQLPCLYGFLMKLGGFPRPGELWGLLHNSVYHPVFRDGQLWRVMAKSRNKQNFRKDMPKFYGLLAALLCCHMTSHPFRLFWRQQSSTIIYPKYAASIHQNKHHLTRRFWKIQTSNSFISLGPKMINSNSSALFSKVSIFFPVWGLSMLQQRCCFRTYKVWRRWWTRTLVDSSWVVQQNSTFWVRLPISNFQKVMC